MNDNDWRSKLEDLDTVMFMGPSCTYCQDMIKIIEEEGVTDKIEILDVSKEENRERAERYGIDKKGVPSFVSKKYSIGTLGSKHSMEDVVNAILRNNPKPNPVSEKTSDEIKEKINNDLQKSIDSLLNKGDGGGSGLFENLMKDISSNKIEAPEYDLYKLKLDSKGLCRLANASSFHKILKIDFDPENNLYIVYCIHIMMEKDNFFDITKKYAEMFSPGIDLSSVDHIYLIFYLLNLF